jgi:hypothetical protein
MAMARRAALTNQPAEIKIRESKPREKIEEISNMTRLPTQMAAGTLATR